MGKVGLSLNLFTFLVMLIYEFVLLLFEFSLETFDLFCVQYLHLILSLHHSLHSSRPQKCSIIASNSICQLLPQLLDLILKLSNHSIFRIFVSVRVILNPLGSIGIS